MPRAVTFALTVLIGAAVPGGALAGPPAVHDTYASGDVAAVIAATKGKFRRCHDAAQRKHAFTDTVVAKVEISIASNGRVSKAELTEPVRADLDACLIRTAKAMRFRKLEHPDPDAPPQRVRFPLAFPAP